MEIQDNASKIQTGDRSEHEFNHLNLNASLDAANTTSTRKHADRTPLDTEANYALPPLHIMFQKTEASKESAPAENVGHMPEQPGQRKEAQALIALQIKMNGPIIRYDLQQNATEIFAVSKTGQLEHWVKVKSESGKDFWVCDRENRLKSEVIRASQLAEQNQRMNKDGMKPAMAAHGKDLPVQMDLKIEKDRSISLSYGFSPDGTKQYKVCHHIGKDGKRSTATTKA